MTESADSALACLKPDRLDDENLVRVLDGLPPPPSLDPERDGTTKLTEGRRRWLCELLAQIPSPKLGAEMLGISVSTIRDMRQRDPEFAAGYSAAMATGREVAASLAYEMAHGIGKSHEVVRTKDGVDVVAVPARRSERMVELIYKLEHAPEFQRHRIEVEGGLGELPPGSMVLAVTPEQLDRLTRDERRQLSALFARIRSLAPATVEGKPNEVLTDGRV